MSDMLDLPLISSYTKLGKSRHLLQIEVRFASSLWQMVAADLPAICFANWVRSSKRDPTGPLNFPLYNL